jgi:uncharacterized iron-regulated protein
MPLILVLTVALMAQAAPPTPPAAPSAPQAAPPASPAAPSAPQTAPSAPATYVPQRVFDTRTGAFTDFEVMLVDLARADVVFVGEQHTDVNTHRLEQALLEGLRRRGVRPIVSFEMFERDVQSVIARYLAGGITEAEMLSGARPWPRYASDYRPLLELARAEGWTVLASNVPRRLASEVAKTGPEALERLSAGDRALAAGDLQCPQDGYFARFAEAMNGHDRPGEQPPEGDRTREAEKAPDAPLAAPAPAPAEPEGAAEQTGAAEARTARYYWSQCVKDETMAESIASAAAARPDGAGPVVHFTGAFHSDFGQGTAQRTRRRLPSGRVAIVTMLPVAGLDGLSPAADDRRRADYLVYTLR